MRLSGFTFVRNATKYGYPVLESVRSALELCDEFVVNVGDSEDGTLQLMESLASPKVKIINSRWDPEMRKAGRILAQQTDIALSHCSGRWALYLQADEVLHEEDLPVINDALDAFETNERVEGFLFEYLHFYASYGTIACGRKWYRREIRVVRRGEGVRSFRDAQGFRRGEEKLSVISLPARVFHYGWVRPPELMGVKKADFDRLWHNDETAQRMNPAPERFQYDTSGFLKKFSGSHPLVMRERISRAGEQAAPPEEAFRFKGNAIEKFLWKLEQMSGVRLGEYRNYRIIGAFPKSSR